MGADTAQVAAAIATMGIFAIAVFHDVIRVLILRPRLGIALQFEPPDCHAALTTDNHQDYYFGLRVSNDGRTSATNVTVTLLDLERKVGDRWDRMPFDEDHLIWRIHAKPNLDSLHPGTRRQCNFGRIVDPSHRMPGYLGQPDGHGGEKRPPHLASVSTSVSVFEFQVSVPRINRTNFVTPGTYRFRVQASCDNSPPVKATLELFLHGDFFVDESRMLSPSGITVRQIT